MIPGIFNNSATVGQLLSQRAPTDASWECFGLQTTGVIPPLSSHLLPFSSSTEQPSSSSQRQILYLIVMHSLTDCWPKIKECKHEVHFGGHFRRILYCLKMFRIQPRRPVLWTAPSPHPARDGRPLKWKLYLGNCCDVVSDGSWKLMMPSYPWQNGMSERISLGREPDWTGPASSSHRS